MPKAMERKLRAEAKKKGLSVKRKNAYIFGTMMKRTISRTGSRNGPAGMRYRPKGYNGTL